jgi:ribulose-phosphate 3-epimerase
MIEVIPAVLVKNFEELKEKLALYKNVSRLVQIDVCDGQFVETISWPMNRNDAESLSLILDEEEGMPYWTDLDFEFDLMVKDAHKQFDIFIQLGAKRIVFHLEAEEEDSFKDFLESIDPYTKDNVEIGLAINTTTDINKLDKFINYIDFVQCMGIENIGFQGEPFDERALEQISSIHKKYPEIPISVDGSVNEQTAQRLIDSGATRLVMGSALLRTYDIKGTIYDFENLE